MKPLLLCCVLLGACAVTQAQKPVGSRALTRASVKGVEWPQFQTGTSGVYLPQFEAVQFLLRNQGFLQGVPTESLTEQNSLAIQRAVKAFQRARGLKVDGLVGAQTWAKLCPRLRRGDRGDAVRALQSLLDVRVDGSFGYGTETALRSAQKNSSLKVDGVAGAQTWAVLLSPPEGGD